MEKGKKIISVIMTTFNIVGLIKKAIQLILKQSYQRFKLVIADDGSTDDTEELTYSFNSPKTIFFYQEKKGISAARNLALSVLKGEYITFLDSDNMYEEEKLDKQLKLSIYDTNSLVIYTAVLCIDDSGEKFEYHYNKYDIADFYKQSGIELNLFPYFNLKSDDIFDDVAYFIPLTILLPTVMFYYKVFFEVGNFCELLDRFEDIDYLRRVSQKYKMLAYNKPTCWIRTHKSNSIKSQKTLEIFKNIDLSIKRSVQYKPNIDYSRIARCPHGIFLEAEVRF
jgi:glycosyltransferase involved in cell wall biosynthesis